MFLTACLENLEMSRQMFAQALNIDLELAEGILDGVLPNTEIDDGLMAAIARVVGFEDSLLRIILGRPIS